MAGCSALVGIPGHRSLSDIEARYEVDGDGPISISDNMQALRVHASGQLSDY